MTEARPRLTWLAGLVAWAVVGLALPAAVLATAPDDAYNAGWSLRFYAAAIDFDEGSPGVGGLSRQGTYGVDFGGGLGVNAEYRFSRRLGVDIGAMVGAGVDLAARSVQAGQVTSLVYDTVSFTPLTAGLDVHLTPDRRVDLYVCPKLAWIRYGRLAVANSTVGVTTEVDFDDDFAVGGAIGIGVPFGKQNWSFEANLTFMDSSMSGTRGDGAIVSTDYGMTIFGVGFGYRF